MDKIDKEKSQILINGFTVLLCVLGPCLGFFYGVGVKLESIDTRLEERFERMASDFRTLENRLERDEIELKRNLSDMDRRLRHVEQLTSRLAGEN